MKGDASSLISAVQKGAIELAKLLLEKGADVNAQVNGESALSAACYHNNTELTKLLLENGTDRYERN